MFGMEPRLPLGTYGPPIFKRQVSLGLKEAGSHFHYIGISGAGKSRALASLFVMLLNRGLSATLVDPHGDLARLCLETLVASGYFKQKDAYKKLSYLNIPAAARKDRYIPFNVMRQHGASPHTIARLVKEGFHRAWPALGDGAAPRFDKLVDYGIKVLASNDLPLPALFRFLLPQEKAFREELCQKEEDADVRMFWLNWYNQLRDRDAIDYSDSATSRISTLVFDPVLKYSLAQKDNFFDFRSRMDNNQSAIVDLSLDNNETRKLFGSLLFVGAEQGAKSRAELPPGERLYSHHLIVDEFGMFAARSEQSINDMLSQTRKYKLFLVMAHQTWSQVSERMKSALQNIGVDVIFKLGREDAEVMAPILTPVNPKTISLQGEEGRESVGMREQWETTTQGIMGLKPRECYIRDPKGNVSFVETLNVPDPKVDRGEIAEIENEYLRLFRSKEEAERDIQAYRVPDPEIHP